MKSTTILNSTHGPEYQFFSTTWSFVALVRHVLGDVVEVGEHEQEGVLVDVEPAGRWGARSDGRRGMEIWGEVDIFSRVVEPGRGGWEG